MGQPEPRVILCKSSLNPRRSSGFNAKTEFSWLAYTCRNLGDYKKTETIERNILKIKQRPFGDHDAEVLDALANISATLACLNNHVKVAKFKETADQIRLRAPEADTGKPFRNGSTNATWLH